MSMSNPSKFEKLIMDESFMTKFNLVVSIIAFCISLGTLVYAIWGDRC